MQTIKYNNLVRNAYYDTVTVSSGTYTAGQIIVSNIRGFYEINDITGDLNQTIAVVLEDKELATDAKILVAKAGRFNRANIIFNVTQTESDVGGALQRAGIYLENWGNN